MNHDICNMSFIPSLNESIHKTEFVKKGKTFLSVGRPCTKIGRLTNGVLRGYLISTSGQEITTHFFQEGDMIIGSFLPNTNASMTVEAIEDSEISVANFQEVMSHVNKDPKIT